MHPAPPRTHPSSRLPKILRDPFALRLAAAVGILIILVWGLLGFDLWRQSKHYLGTALLLSLLIVGGAVFILAAYRREIGLKESARRWQTIFEHAGWGVAIGSADGKTLEQMNPAFADMHGYSVEELTGQPIDLVFSAEDPVNTARRLAQGPSRFEALHRHRDGHSIPVLVDVTTVKNEAGETLYRVLNVQDITAIRQAQEEMRIAKEFFQHTFDAAPAGMAIADVDGRYTRVNRAMCEFTGYSESELLTMNYIDITHPDDVESNVYARQSLLDYNCQSFQVEKRYLHKDGREIWALLVVLLVSNSDGRPLYSIGQILDIDALKRAEQALRISEERFRGIFENANTGFAATDLKGDIIYFNEAFRAMFGHDAASLKKMHITDFSLPEDRDREKRLFAGILQHQRDRYRLEKRYISPDGRIFWMDFYVSTICDDAGQIVNFIGVASDITERKEFALALAESKHKLRTLAAYQEERLEQERKHIAREVHDELGQLLTALKMDISLVRLRFGSNVELLGRIEEMRQLVEKTITVVRQVASNLRPAALDLGLTPAIEWLADDFSRRWAIPCRLEGDEGEIRLNEQQSTAVFRVVQESLTNVARHAAAGQVIITLRQREQGLRVAVNDNGRGFDTVVVSKERGFGLFGMRERALALGGSLRIISSPGQGTTVVIELPLLPSEPS